MTRNEKYSLADYILNDFTVRSRLIVKSFGASDIGTYTCVGRNMFNNKGDREEADIIVNFVESKNSKLFPILNKKGVLEISYGRSHM